MNVIYQGIRNTPISNFRLDSRSALFATTQKYGNFPALNAANSEVNYIFESYKAKFQSSNKSRKFINRDFSFDKLSSEFKSFSTVIHIATHYNANRDSGGLLLGTGQIINAAEIWNRLPQTNTSKLITISTCQV